MAETTLDMGGKVCLVTGGNSGIGKATALGLAKLGATVVIVSRDKDKGEAALIEIKAKSTNPDVDVLQADLSSRDSVRELGFDFEARYKRLHVLVNNAGLFLAKRSVTVDGLETMFAVNVLGPFLLTNLLLDVLKLSAPSRIVNVTSDAHYGARVNFEDLQHEKKYSGFGVYGETKLELVLLTYEFARRLQGTGVTVNCAHPGVVRTNFARNNGGIFGIFTILSPFFISADKAAKRIIYVAAAPELEAVTGKYFTKMREVKSSPESYDEEAARRLWERSTELARLPSYLSL